MTSPVQPTAQDRLFTAIRNLIRAEFPQYTYCGVYEYSIQAVNSGTGAVDCEPTDTTISLPNLSNVLFSPSLLAESCTATMGSTCLVEFVNSDPTRPRIVSVGPTVFMGTLDASQTMNIGPSAGSVNLGAAQMPTARTTDTVSVYFPPGTTLTIAGVAIPPALGVVTATLQFTLGPGGPPLACVGLIGPASTAVFA